MSSNATIPFPDSSVTAATLFAEVIIPLALPNTYTYEVPAQYKDAVQPGCRVEVVLGKSKRYAGIVKSLSQQRPGYQTKFILNVLDEEPVLYPEQLQLWSWISQYYMCSEGEVMAAALPAHFKLSSESIFLYNEMYGDDFTHLDHEEYVVAEALLIKKQLSMTEVQQLLDHAHVYPVVKRLVEQQVCIVVENLAEKYTIRTENFVTLCDAYKQESTLEALLNDSDKSFSRAHKQLELLLSYLHLAKQEGRVTQAALLKKSGANAAQLKGLVEKGILQVEKRAVDRLPILPPLLEVDFELSAAQQTAFNQLQIQLQQKQVCLLQGVTGSGKTQLYVKIIEQYFNEGKQVLYLLPEIALTAQMIRRLQHHFGGNIAIYHSKFNNNERVEIWNRIRTGKTRIVLGARSALFLPFSNLGLVIVDEEHDASFKQQDPAPRYHARDAAIYFASLTGAKVLLGSATPALESFYNARQGKYGLVQLQERYGGLKLPVIEMVDTRQVAKKGKVMLSPQLKEAIQQTMDADKQIILFQNRRGYAPYLICGTCGYLPQCNHCDVTLTLHKYSNKLHCHYCGCTYPRLVECPACGTINWLEKNFGTEKIEEQLETEFSAAKVARMDVDSVRGKSAHDNLIRLFEQHRIDILVGTQMVVKGLDFEKVGLVGILDADGLMGFADFRVYERAFQLMEQVSGRAGRKEAAGRVVIQTTQPNHPVLQLVQRHDYTGLFTFELENRRQFFYPPFSRLIQVTLKHKRKEVVEAAALKLSNALQQYGQCKVVGPAAPVVGRVRTLYLMELMLKMPPSFQLLQQFKLIIRNHFNLLLAEREYRSLVMVADVDPQ